MFVYRASFHNVRKVDFREWTFARRGAHELREHGSDRRETSAKRVSDDLQLSIFWRRKNFFEKIFRIFFWFSRFSSDFGGFGEFWTSKSGSWRHFAADGRVLRPVRGLEAMIHDYWSLTDDYWLETDDEWLNVDD